MKKALLGLIFIVLVAIISACVFENPQVVFEDENFDEWT